MRRAWRSTAAAMMVAACGGEVPDDEAEASACEAPAERAGEATYYAADGSGNCSFDPTGEAPLLVAALNDVDYDGASMCGACAAVEGPDGAVVVRIVDRCPGCGEGDIDLSADAFAAIAPLEAGRVAVSWNEVPCEPKASIRLRFKDGTNPYWAAVQVDSHRHAIRSVDTRTPAPSSGGVLDWLEAPGAWNPLRRELYNYFVADDGLGDGPVDLRITDTHGHELIVETVTPGDGVSLDTGLQLPACHAAERPDPR